MKIQPGDRVKLKPEEGMIVPPGWHTVSQLMDNGSFCVGGNIGVWTRRVEEHIPAELIQTHDNSDIG